MDDLLTHVFWFRRLPTEGPSPVDESGEFLQVFADFLENDDALRKEKKLRPFVHMMRRWATIQAKHTEVRGTTTIRLQMRVDETRKILEEMAPGESLPLYIPGCNAAIIITMKEDDRAVVSGFTVHPSNRTIMSTMGDLVAVYPEVSINVADKKALLLQTELLDTIKELCFNEFEEIMPKSKKKGDVNETRDVVSSRYVMQWLLSVLCDYESSTSDHEPTQKKIRNSIEWNNALLPFRRSGLWFTMKVALQTTCVEVWKGQG